MLEAARDIEQYVARFEDAGAFSRSDEPKWAVLQRLTVLGEAAGQVSVELRTAHPEIEWSVARAMRNFIVHGYYDLEWEIIWETSMRNVPGLRQRLELLIVQETGSEG